MSTSYHLRPLVGLICAGGLLWAGCATPGAAAPRTASTPHLPGDSYVPQTAKNRAVDNDRPPFVVALGGGKTAIKRAALVALQKAGAQAFISKIQVRPAFRAGRFSGWRVLAYRGPGRLEVGDIVASINGRSIERPAQFMAVWQSMVSAPQLVVTLVRGGRPLTFTLPIVD